MVMIQRTVVIYRDDKGFGLRVSGENPVFVESVKTDGAAWKAGIRSGDRIIKVNGTTVNNHSHQEVVHMIQYCGNHVALTLRGSTNQLPTNQLLANNQSTLINDQQNLLPINNLPLNLASSTSTRIRPYNNSVINNLKDSQRHITPPLPANDSTLIEFEKSRLETIKKMLGDEREFLNKLRKEEKYPNEKETEINATMNRIKKLEEQLSSANETNRQTVARYIIPLDASFSQLNLKLNTSTHSSSRTSSNSSINQHHHHHHQNFNLVNNNNISRRHLSAENLHFFTQLPNNNEQIIETTTKKSHSFGQYDHQTSQTLQNLQNQSINNSIDSQLNSTLNSSTASKDTGISFYSSSSYLNLQNSNKNLSQDEQEFDISYLINNNNNNKSNIDLLLEPKNVNLLFNFLHYLLINKQDINPLLFYILTDLFKKVCENPKFSCLDNSTSLQHHIRKWAFEIYSTFLFNDSPLRLNCDFVMKDQTQFYELLNENFTSATTLVNTIFDPYLDKSKEIINQQIEQFKKNLNSNLLNGSNSNQLIIKKIQPSIIVECLTNELTDLPTQVSINASNSSTLLTQITILISYLLNSTLNSNSSIQSIAQLTCFTSILYHCFPHFLVSSDENANTLAKLIPVPVYLSFHQTNNHSNQLQHKRHKSLPASSNNQQSNTITTTITNINSSSAIPYHLSSLSQPTGNHNPPPVINSSCNSNQPKTLAQQANNNQIFLNSGHVFSLLNTTKPNNCSGCQQSIWAMFGWHCQLCLLTAHHWCLRSTAEDHHCPGPIDHVLDNQNNDLNQNNINNLQHLSSTILSSSSRSKSKSNIKSTGGRLLENILKNRAESLKHKKEEANNKCVRKKSDPSISSSSNLFQNDFNTASRNKYLHSPSSSSDSELEDNQFLNQNEHSFSIFNDNMFNRDDQILIDNDSRQLSPNYLSNLPPRSNSSVQLSTEMKKANKRQDIFKELISTERTHVKNLKILNDIFYRPIYQEQLLAPEHIDYIFSNHYQLHEIHSQIYSLLKQKKKEQQKCIQDQLQYPQQHNNQFIILDQGIGQLLVQIFEGEIGKRLEEAASVFCAKQTIGGDILRNKLKKDSKLSSFLQEAEANKCCRRLQLKG